jgi:DNA-damage-inducible protein J
MATSSMIHVRIDDQIKLKAAQALEEMGLSVADAIRILLVRIASERAIPFEIRVPNHVTIAAMEAARRGEGEVVTLKDLADEWED